MTLFSRVKSSTFAQQRKGQSVIKGLRILSESAEGAIFAHVREEVGAAGDLIDRLTQDPAQVELEEGHVLVTLTSNERALLVTSSRGIAALSATRMHGHRFGFFPISVLTLASLDPGIAKLMEIED